MRSAVTETSGTASVVALAADYRSDRFASLRGGPWLGEFITTVQIGACSYYFQSVTVSVGTPRQGI